MTTESGLSAPTVERTTETPKFIVPAGDLSIPEMASIMHIMEGLGDLTEVPRFKVFFKGLAEAMSGNINSYRYDTSEETVS